MVQDVRVNRQLARLGGVYRDPARVNRDASSLLKSSVGTHLIPIAAEYTDDTGSTNTVLVLQGTIAIHFRGNTYQLLVDLYLVSSYPNRPPVAFVRLAPNMYLKENHKHVGSDGKVYLPYLHNWHNVTHNLVELTVAMSSVFSADPPVFSRPPAPPPSETSPPPFAAALTSIDNSTTTKSSNNWESQQDELKAALAASRAEAAAREQQALREEQEAIARAERESAAIAYEQAQLRQLRESLQSKLQAHFRQLAASTRDVVQEDAMDQQILQCQGSLETQIILYRDKKIDLERQTCVADRAVADIETWLNEAQQITQDPCSSEKKTIDEICVPESTLAKQQLELAAENASIQDVLYFLDRALYADRLTPTQHLRQVRALAKRQFLVRAHLLKIQQRARLQQF